MLVSTYLLPKDTGKPIGVWEHLRTLPILEGNTKQQDDRQGYKPKDFHFLPFFLGFTANDCS